MAVTFAIKAALLLFQGENMKTSRLILWPSTECPKGGDVVESSAIARSRKRIYFARLLMVLALFVMMAGCGSQTPEPIDAAHISGRWELVTGDETEFFDISADGGFSATIRNHGFISATLSQGESIRIQGRWQFAEKRLILQIEKSSDAGLVGQEYRYTIESLSNHSMLTVDANGRKQTLLKAI